MTLTDINAGLALLIACAHLAWTIWRESTAHKPKLRVEFSMTLLTAPVQAVGPEEKPMMLMGGPVVTLRVVNRIGRPITLKSCRLRFERASGLWVRRERREAIPSPWRELQRKTPPLSPFGSIDFPPLHIGQVASLYRLGKANGRRATGSP